MNKIERPEFIPKWMWEYVRKEINEHNFDSSHDLQHFVNVYNYAKLLMDRTFDNDTIQKAPRYFIILHSAFCHDIIDKKYVNENEAIQKLREEFNSQLYTDTDSVVELITHMSFSKRKANRLAGNADFPLRTEIPLEILSEADILDAYRPERVVAYQNKVWPCSCDSETAKRWCKTILVKRVLRYLPDKYITSKKGIELALPMHASVEKYVKENYPEDLEMFDY